VHLVTCSFFGMGRMELGDEAAPAGLDSWPTDGLGQGLQNLTPVFTPTFRQLHSRRSGLYAGACNLHLPLVLRCVLAEI
jgi:hypothetical protein